MKVVYSHNRVVDLIMDDSLVFNSDCVQGRLETSPRGGVTVAMEVIQSSLLPYLGQGDTIVRKLGLAKCSDEDNYCKKTGRELAFSRLKETTLTVVNIVKLLAFVIVFFEDEDGNLYEVKSSNDPDCAILVRMLNE